MHVRFSTCIGTPIVCDSLNEVVGRIFDVLIHPDTGALEGFFVFGPHGSGTPFLASMDIVRWGTQVHIHHIDAIYPLEDRIRLQPILEEERRILYQRICTENGKRLGMCKDIQFDTRTMKCEWLFPKKWWKWGMPIPISSVVEVQQKCILVKDTLLPTKKEPVQENSFVEGFDAVLPDISAAPKT